MCNPSPVHTFKKESLFSLRVRVKRSLSQEFKERDENYFYIRVLYKE